jgi:hypothetical protein
VPCFVLLEANFTCVFFTENLAKKIKHGILLGGFESRLEPRVAGLDLFSMVCDRRLWRRLSCASRRAPNRVPTRTRGSGGVTVVTSLEPWASRALWAFFSWLFKRANVESVIHFSTVEIVSQE